MNNFVLIMVKTGAFSETPLVFKWLILNDYVFFFIVILQF